MIATPDPYVVKLLHAEDELRAAFRLRHEIFHVEHHGRYLSEGLDRDEVDETCAHLGVFLNGEIVGTYRLNPSHTSRAYYADSRFHLDKILALPGTKVELGRACVSAEHRSGIVLQLLWRGIAEYLRMTRARYLFGCSSIRVEDPATVARIFESLRAKGHLSTTVWVDVREGRRFPTELAAGPHVAEEKIPSLFRMYLKAGAQVVASPAWDKFMGCADFLTLLDVHQTQESFARKYRPVAELR